MYLSRSLYDQGLSIMFNGQIKLEKLNLEIINLYVIKRSSNAKGANVLKKGKAH